MKKSLIIALFVLGSFSAAWAGTWQWNYKVGTYPLGVSTNAKTIAKGCWVRCTGATACVWAIKTPAITHTVYTDLMFPLPASSQATWFPFNTPAGLDVYGKVMAQGGAVVDVTGATAHNCMINK